jgi:Na+/H+-dicarboxylate symporter
LSDKKQKFPLFAQILVAMIAGGVVGTVFGEQAGPLGEIGSVIIAVIKSMAAPLLFLGVVEAFVTTDIRMKDGLRLLAINGTNAAIALGIGLGISNIFRPGESLVPPPAATVPLGVGQHLDFAATFKGYIPTNLFRPFVDDTMISIIIVALISGIALRTVKNEQKAAGQTSFETIEAGIHTLYRSVQVAIGWMVKLVPLAVFSVVAKTIGQQGFAPARGMAIYLAAAIGGILLHVLVVYQSWIVFVARMPLRVFWGGCRDALAYAIGASSSLATLPVTLRCLEKMKVSRESSVLAACVGTNLNNDSILLYEAMAALFVAQAYGIDLSVTQQLAVGGACVVAGIGISGVPDAGLISLSLVMGTVGLPLEILPLLLTVDWLLSRIRAASNVTCDILVAVLLDRFKSPREAAISAAEHGTH